jgi:hypothetical protein
MPNYFIADFCVSSELDGREIRKLTQLAFAFNPESKRLIIDRSGHASMIRKFNLDRRDYQGGWLFPKQGKITFYSGTLGHVEEQYQYDVASIISQHIGLFCFLRVA